MQALAWLRCGTSVGDEYPMHSHDALSPHASHAPLAEPREKYRAIRDDSLIELPAVNFISTNLRSKRVPWCYMAYTVADSDNFFHHGCCHLYEVRDIWFYSHNLLQKGPRGPNYKNNIDYQMLSAIESLGFIPEFDTHELIRAQANCVHRMEKAQITPAHRDFDGAGCVYVYYVNDADGDTILFDDDGNIEATITPAAGHILRMDSTQWHCQTTPIRTDRRMVINLNFKEK